MLESIFKEYDIRGKVGSELLLEEVEKLGHAIAYFFYEEHPSVKSVVVGMDARSSSPAIKESLCKALQESGLDIVFVDICPSPVLYFGLFTLPVDAGLMITASHNPAEYNGIKVALDKRFIWGDQIRYIGKLYREGKKVTGKKPGSYTSYNLIEQYVQWMLGHFPALKNMALPAVVDSGNGTGGTVMTPLVKAFGWRTIDLLCNDIHGTPLHEADPVVEKNMVCVKKALSTGKYAIGVGLDGDGDRMDAMTPRGFLIPGDRLLALFAEPIVKKNPGAAVVCDIKSSSGLIELLQQWGAKPVISPSGHAIIKEHMHKNDALLGGELSCHFFFSDRYFGYDDGIYALLRLFEILVETGKSIDELIAIFPARVSSSEFRIPCPDEKKKIIIAQVKSYFESKKDVQLLTIDGVRATLPYGWGIVRASNTQPVLSIRFEANTAQDLEQVKKEFIKAFGSAYTEMPLSKAFELGD